MAPSCVVCFASDGPLKRFPCCDAVYCSSCAAETAENECTRGRGKSCPLVRRAFKRPDAAKNGLRLVDFDRRRLRRVLRGSRRRWRRRRVGRRAARRGRRDRRRRTGGCASGRVGRRVSRRASAATHAHDPNDARRRAAAVERRAAAPEGAPRDHRPARAPRRGGVDAGPRRGQTTCCLQDARSPSAVCLSPKAILGDVRCCRSVPVYTARRRRSDAARAKSLLGTGAASATSTSRANLLLRFGSHTRGSALDFLGIIWMGTTRPTRGGETVV